MQYHIFCPDHFCPIGAHVDHHHGLMIGYVIDNDFDSATVMTWLLSCIPM